MAAKCTKRAYIRRTSAEGGDIREAEFDNDASQAIRHGKHFFVYSALVFFVDMGFLVSCGHGSVCLHFGIGGRPAE